MGSRKYKISIAGGRQWINIEGRRRCWISIVGRHQYLVKVLEFFNEDSILREATNSESWKACVVDETRTLHVYHLAIGVFMH